MSSRSLGSELPEPPEAGPGGDAADAGATRGAQRSESTPLVMRHGAATQQRLACSAVCAPRCSCAQTDALCLRRSSGLLRRLHAPGAPPVAPRVALSRRAQRSARDMPRTLTFAPRGARRLQTSLLWASTSSRSTCASPSRSSSPPRCRPRAAGAHTRAAPSPRRSARSLAGPHPRHRQDGADVQVRTRLLQPRDPTHSAAPAMQRLMLRVAPRAGSMWTPGWTP